MEPEPALRCPGHGIARPLLPALLPPLAGLLLVSLVARQATAAPPTAVCEVTARTVSWMPIRMEDVAAGIATQVTAALGSGDLLAVRRGQRTEGAQPATSVAADFLLLVEGDIVEEAGNFTVTLSLRPVRDAGLPSFVAAATVSISGRPRAEMYRLILEAAKSAAERMRGTLAAQRSAFGHPGGDAGPLPADLFDWGKLEPPRARGPASGDMATFASDRLAWEQRKEPGFRLAALAVDRPEIRHLLERVALTDRDPIARYYALRFLEPSSRLYPFTQRVILAVAREESEPKAKAMALGLSQHFLGRSATETLQTWVQLLAARVAELDNRGFAALAKLLSFRPETPNIDAGVLACLRQEEALEEGRERKRECLSLLAKLPVRRRTGVLLGYINQSIDKLVSDLPGEHDHGPLGAAIQQVLKDPCQRPRSRQLLLRLLAGSTRPHLAALVLETLVKDQLTPELVKTIAARLREDAGGDPGQRARLLDLLTDGVSQHQPPWGVLAWPELRAALGELAAGALAANEKREVERTLVQLGKLEAQAHKVGLGQHLRADQPPAEGAVPYFAGCVLGRDQEKEQGDCVEGLAWLVKQVPQLRRQAFAAMQGLLIQTNKTLAPRTVQRLQSAVRGLTWQARRTAEDEGSECPID